MEDLSVFGGGDEEGNLEGNCCLKDNNYLLSSHLSLII
jgi:hypothetical protein